MTGRPLRWAEDVFEYVGSHGLAIVSNGALVWDVARRRGAPRAADRRRTSALEVCRLLRDAVPGSAFAVETLDGIGAGAGVPRAAPGPRRRRARARSRSSSTRRSLKLLARHEELGAAGVLGRAPRRRSATGGDHLVLGVVAARDQRAGVTKASTLALLCAELGVDAEDVIAFGDMPNDLPMLEWAGTSYAMADAHPTVVEAADHVAPGARRRRRGDGAGWYLRPVICCDARVLARLAVRPCCCACSVRAGAGRRRRRAATLSARRRASRRPSRTARKAAMAVFTGEVTDVTREDRPAGSRARTSSRRHGRPGLPGRGRRRETVAGAYRHRAGRGAGVRARQAADRHDVHVLRRRRRRPVGLPTGAAAPRPRPTELVARSSDCSARAGPPVDRRPSRRRRSSPRSTRRRAEPLSPASPLPGSALVLDRPARAWCWCAGPARRRRGSSS